MHGKIRISTVEFETDLSALLESTKGLIPVTASFIKRGNSHEKDSLVNQAGLLYNEDIRKGSIGMVVTTEEMMEQAIRMFKEYGYSQVSVDMICRSFHVTKGSFYHHFKSKEELLVKWFNALMEQMEHIALDSFFTIF